MRHVLFTLIGLWFLWGCGGTPARGPGDRGGAPGLTVYTWVLDDNPVGASEDPQRLLQSPQSLPLPGALTKYADRALPMGPGEAGRWGANSLRVFAVPTGEVAGLRAGLRLTQRIQERSLGEVSEWTEIARGQRWDSARYLMLDTGAVRLSPGCLRLLCRAWVIPADGGEGAAETGAALQVELAIQHVPDEAPAARLTIDALSPSASRRVEEQGTVFSRLSVEMVMDGEAALVIAPERPDARVAPASPGQVRAWWMGPPAPDQLTLGDALLSDFAGRTARGARVAVVLVPAVPRAFGLEP